MTANIYSNKKVNYQPDNFYSISEEYVQTHHEDYLLEDNQQCAKENLTIGAYVDTNIGLIPVEDYLEIKASQYGYDSYKDLWQMECSSMC